MKLNKSDRKDIEFHTVPKALKALSICGPSNFNGGRKRVVFIEI